MSAVLPGIADAQTIARAAAMLALGRALVDSLDAGLGDPMAKILPLVDAASADAASLQRVNQDLLPLMQRLTRKHKGPSWLRWFSGESLEQEVLFEQVQHEIEALVEMGERTQMRLKTHAQTLEAERISMANEVQRLLTDAAAIRLLLGPAYVRARREAGLLMDDLERLARRAANLDTLAAALELSRGQYDVTTTHLLAVADRFTEVRALLVPLWKQAMGFELFARRTAEPNPFER